MLRRSAKWFSVRVANVNVNPSGSIRCRHTHLPQRRTRPLASTRTPSNFRIKVFSTKASSNDSGSITDGGDDGNYIGSAQKRKSTIFEKPLLGGHGQKEGGLADKQKKEDEDLRKALENDPVGQAKMGCMAWEEETEGREEVCRETGTQKHAQCTKSKAE